jgi:leucyl aminopeptidase
MDKIVEQISAPNKEHSIILSTKWNGESFPFFNKEEAKWIEKKTENGENSIIINKLGVIHIVYIAKSEKNESQQLETLRKEGAKAQRSLAEVKAKSVSIISELPNNQTLAFLEGILLSDYQFIKYFSNSDDKKSLLKQINIVSPTLSSKEIDNQINIIDAVCMVRDLVNEPASFLTASRLSEIIEKIGLEAGFKVDVFHQQKIESLKMGGILAVNQGSTEPATFSILEYKPENAINEKPYVLVGKGLVYDTGGLSLKPTADSMDYMKSDMAGGATVAATIYAIAKNQLPLYIVGLVPATDNRIDAKAYAPGDVITMYNGTTVEVVNSDAEGRLILADALSYAQKFNPELVINMATLTGAASVAIGPNGIVAMGNAPEQTMSELKSSGLNTYERIAEFPFWDDYKDLIKSDIADLKNSGGRYAGSITAGKFLEHFTDYPFIHLDIAGVAYLKSTDSYRKKGGSGICVRLLYDFFYNKVENR